MLVVSDTSPLNYLVLIGEVELLPRLFTSVLAPPAVLEEMKHAGSPAAVREWAIAPPAWLTIAAPTSDSVRVQLGRGETDAIRLAIEHQADAVLIDERRGTAVARQLGLSVVGTLAILQAASERALVDLPEAIGKLRKTSFRASEELLQSLLRRRHA